MSKRKPYKRYSPEFKRHALNSTIYLGALLFF